jgi:hypothetical protein
VYRAFVIAPIFAAVAFVIPQSFQLMHRPDSIYIPVIFEALLFAIGYVVFGAINAVVITPLCTRLASRTSSRLAGLALAFAVAALGSYLVYAAGIFGHKSSIMHRAYLLGAYLPLFLTTAASFYFVVQHRSATPEQSNAGTQK